MIIVLCFLSNKTYPGNNFTIEKYSGLIHCCVFKLFRHCITSFLYVALVVLLFMRRKSSRNLAIFSNKCNDWLLH